MSTVMQFLKSPSPMMNNIKQMMQFVKSANNPQEALTQLANTNPQVRQALEIAGSNPKEAFYALAKQRGINPDDVLNMLK